MAPSSSYHILNGDSLKGQLAGHLQGEVFVLRECLVDGPVQGKTLEELYDTRAAFINQYCQPCSVEDYKQETVVEFEKILNIPNNSDVHLWFEEDLFCQVNFWFSLYLLTKNRVERNLYLVKPNASSPYSFAAFETPALLDLLANRVKITEAKSLSMLWQYYVNDDFEGLQKLAADYNIKYPFLLSAIKAHIDRQPTEVSAGRPVESLKKIMEQHGTSNFGSVFREFCRQEAIYGFGDLQVKRLFDQLIHELD